MQPPVDRFLEQTKKRNQCSNCASGVVGLKAKPRLQLNYAAR